MKGRMLVPHVVLRGAVTVADFEDSFHSLRESGEWLIKIDELYVERNHKQALMPVIVIEEGHSQKFYIKLSMNEELHSCTIRLDPSTDPVKTRGVKRSVALVAEWFIAHCNQVTVDRHNLNDFLTVSVNSSSAL